MNKDDIFKQFYDFLYNPDLKIKFIKENYHVEKTQETILRYFAKAANSEKYFNKDLCVMNLKEVNDVAEGLGYVSEITIGTALSYFKTYVDWCMVNNLRGSYEDGINNVAIFQSTQDFSKFISKIKNKHRYITKQELAQALNYTENFPDKALLLALYEGIAGEELYELRSMEVKNIIEETNQIVLTDIDKKQKTKKRRVKSISKELVYILLYANTQKERYAEGKPTLYADTKYIIKPVTRSQHSSEDMIEYNTLSARFQTLKREVGLDFVTPLSLQVSGQIARVEELTMRYGLDEPNDAIFNELMLPTEYNLTRMQVYNLKQKYNIATKLKSFK